MITRERSYLRSLVLLVSTGLVLSMAGCEGCGEPECEPGSKDCPCDDGKCDGDLVCKDDKCVTDACPAGTEGCPCGAANTCNVGLNCVDDVCEAGSTIAGLSVGSAAVRSCDLLLELGGADVNHVAFDDAVIGRFRLDGERLGIAFTAKADSALGAVAALQGSGGDVDMSSIVASTVTCYDRLGAAVADPDVRLR